MLAGQEGSFALLMSVIWIISAVQYEIFIYHFSFTSKKNNCIWADNNPQFLYCNKITDILKSVLPLDHTDPAPPPLPILNNTARYIFLSLWSLKSIRGIWVELAPDQTEFSLMKRSLVPPAACGSSEQGNNGKNAQCSEQWDPCSLSTWDSVRRIPSDHSPIKSCTQTHTHTHLHVEWPASIMNMDVLEECKYTVASCRQTSRQTVSSTTKRWKGTKEQLRCLHFQLCHSHKPLIALEYVHIWYCLSVDAVLLCFSWHFYTRSSVSPTTISKNHQSDKLKTRSKSPAGASGGWGDAEDESRLWMNDSGTFC